MWFKIDDVNINSTDIFKIELLPAPGNKCYVHFQMMKGDDYSSKSMSKTAGLKFIDKWVKNENKQT